jgi:hemerythrin-like domain-containing protein
MNQSKNEQQVEVMNMSPTEMLRQDHKRVQDLFDAFEEAQTPEQKKEIVQTALRELKIHTALEEEIFYPAVRQELGEEESDLMDAALEEHHVAKVVIQELEEMKPEDERYDAKFKVLGESVKHHIQEEESEMLPKAEEISIEELGEEMMERKQELEEEMEQSGSSASRGRKKTQGGRAQSKSKGGRSKSKSKKR